MLRILGLIAALAALGAAAAAPARAQSLAQPPEVARIDVLEGWRTEAGTRMAAIRIRLSEGWKTYWRSPGEGGIPPQFDFSGSQNLNAVRIHWPVPHLFSTNGLRSIGYKGTVVLPIELVPEDPAAPIALSAQLRIGVCEDICIPYETRLKVRLAEAGAPDAAISASLKNAPIGPREAGLREAVCKLEPISDGLHLQLRLEMPPLGPGEQAVIELPDPEIWVGQALTERKGDTLEASTDLVPPSGAPFALQRADIRITVLSENGRAAEILGCNAG